MGEKNVVRYRTKNVDHTTLHVDCKMKVRTTCTLPRSRVGLGLLFLMLICGTNIDTKDNNKNSTRRNQCQTNNY